MHEKVLGSVLDISNLKRKDQTVGDVKNLFLRPWTVSVSLSRKHWTRFTYLTDYKAALCDHESRSKGPLSWEVTSSIPAFIS